MIDQPVHFLLVDDLEQNLVALETLLRRDGLVILTAKSGTEALELLLQHEVALALIDVQMPVMDGFELAELMRGYERTRHVPIIFLTAGSTDEKRRFRGYEAGAVDFLSKPIETDILKSKAGIFFDLFRQRQEVARQRDELAVMVRENGKLLEESRRYAEALKETDRRKDEFLATLAHELRNPLAPIINSVQVLQMVGGPEQENAGMHSIIERQVKHMVRLVDDLLEVSRITSGKIELQPTLIDIREAVNNAVETTRPVLESGQHSFEARLPEEPLRVEADMVRITQVLANLLNNAGKYTPEGGRITLEAERQDDQAVITIRDTGLGIPVHMLHNVFEMFTQINRNLKRSQGGLGIGLTLVKRLVELHGGSVAVHSEGENLGSEFTVTLPLAERVDEQGQDADAPQQQAHAAQRILIIDDNHDCLTSLTMLLEIYGHEVASAQNGRDGLKAVEDFEPSVIILDLGMPEMDGYETARRLRKLDAGEDALLIALTGWGQDQDRDRTRDAGFDFHLTKPVDPQALQSMLHSYSEQSRTALPSS